MAFPQYTLTKRATSSTGLNYSDLYGANPYKDTSRKIQELIDRVTAGAGQCGGGRSRTGTSTSYGSRDTSVARPGDAEVRDYMSNVLAGQRNALDEYVRRSAGVGSGARSPAGGLPLESALYDKAMKNLAGGYSDRFREAMDYNKYAKASRYRDQSDSVRNLQDLLGIQHKYLTSEADWQSTLADKILADRYAQQQASAAQTERQLALERMRQLMEMEQWRAYMEKRDRSQTGKAKDELDIKFAQLAKKMGMNQLGTSLSPGDQLWSERIGVDLGYLKPWQRSLSVRMGNK
jgi:hypothetical protein